MPERIESEHIDVAATIAALRAQAVARGKAMGLTEQATLDDPLRQAADLAHISAHFPIMWRVPVVGRMLSLARRAIRIGLRWYINPIVDQINDFNEATITALNTLAARQEALAARVAALELGDGPHPPPAQRAPGFPTGEGGATENGVEAPLSRTAGAGCPPGGTGVGAAS
jgi:hypothetical protein